MTDKEKVEKLEIELHRVNLELGRVRADFKNTWNELKNTKRKLAETETYIKNDAQNKLEKTFNWLPLSIKGKYNEHQLAEALVKSKYLSDKQLSNLPEGYTHKAGFIHLFNKPIVSDYYQQINLKMELRELVDLFFRFQISGVHINKIVSQFLLLNDKTIDLKVFKSTVNKGVKNQKRIEEIELSLKK